MRAAAVWAFSSGLRACMGQLDAAALTQRPPSAGMSGPSWQRCWVTRTKNLKQDGQTTGCAATMRRARALAQQGLAALSTDLPARTRQELCRCEQHPHQFSTQLSLFKGTAGCMALGREAVGFTSLEHCNGALVARMALHPLSTGASGLTACHAYTVVLFGTLAVKHLQGTLLPVASAACAASEKLRPQLCCFGDLLACLKSAAGASAAC